MNIIKDYYKILIGFILGLLFSCGFAFAASIFLSSQISYTPKTGNTSPISVDKALDELYLKTNNCTDVDSFFFIVWNSDNGFYYSNYQNYKYFRISQTNTGTSSSISIVKYNWDNGGASLNLQMDTKYPITTNNEQVVIKTSGGYRNVKVEFFKT